MSSSPLVRRMLRGVKSGMVIVLIIGLSIAAVSSLDYLERRHALRVDNSFNGITSQSAASNSVLLGLTQDVHAYALFSRGQEDYSLIGLLERFAAQSAHFTFSLEDLAVNPNLVQAISSDLDDEDISTDSLIIHSPDTGRTRILGGIDFVQQSYNQDSGSIYVSGFNYEKSLTEAVVYVTSARIPQVQILSGHGELGSAQTAQMENLLLDYHYGASRVELLRENSLSPEHPLLIMSPQKDFTSAEIRALDAFTRAGGSMLLTDDFGGATSLPNFESFLRGYGFVKRPGLVVAQEGSADAYPDMPAVLIPRMLSTEPTAAMVASGQTSLVLPGSASFLQPDGIDSGLVNQVVLHSGPAYIRNAVDLSETIFRQPDDEEGDFILAMLADRAFEDGTRSRAFIIGSSGLFTESWMHDNTYSAELLLNVINYLDPGSPIDLPISPKDALRKPFGVPSNLLMGLLVSVPPLAVLCIAVLVLIPRRRL